MCVCKTIKAIMDMRGMELRRPFQGLYILFRLPVAYFLLGYVMFDTIYLILENSCLFKVFFLKITDVQYKLTQIFFQLFTGFLFFFFFC